MSSFMNDSLPSWALEARLNYVVLQKAEDSAEAPGEQRLELGCLQKVSGGRHQNSSNLT